MVGRLLRPTAKLLPKDSRAHNRSLVLQHLFHSGPTTRTRLADASGLTRVTVADLVKDLLAAGLVEELEAEPRGRVGKPATRVRLRVEQFHIAVLDLTGGDEVHGAVVDLSGAVITRRVSHTAGLRGADALDAVQRLAGELVADAAMPVLGVGVGSPGVIDASGTVVDAPNRGWTGVPLSARLGSVLGLPVHVANDADVAVLGELAYGGAGPLDVMALHVGQGVGAGVVTNGHLVRGSNFAAGEVGHLTVVDERDGDIHDPYRLGPPLPCACGRTGCLETILSLPALRARVEGLDEAGRSEALAAVGRRLGIALAPVVAALNVGEIVLIGRTDLLGGPLAEGMLTMVRHRTMPVTSAGLTVRTTSLGEDSVLLGAAGLVLSEELGFS
ncbi:ROK family transcriptional regulator [Georgenia satyanarayanai]|uniref:ROK family transcriptional regulator n=1 Tax=Georgenia satyanarayanai TaxID=860221 RepID=UPI00203D431A|nr:ROK family transcriptional regulator [Georgenia satyanarayanai]MCM3660262.1 ROK family transcriptional regulator [Georgenia satyanarayanai]